MLVHQTCFDTANTHINVNIWLTNKHMYDYITRLYTTTLVMSKSRPEHPQKDTMN